MSFLKGFVLTIFAILLVVFLVAFQLDNTLNNTVLSSGYFNRAFDKNVTPESMENFAVYLKGNVGDASNEDLNKIIQDAIDVKWMQKDMPAFLKGCFAFFATGEGKLPSISIKPMKEAMSKAITTQAGAAAPIVESELGLDKMKDTFDASVYFSKLYGGSVNPVTGFGDIVSSTRRSFFMLIIAAALLLFAVIAVIAFRPRSILRWGGSCLLIAGLFCALPALIPVVFRSTLSAPVSLAIGGGEASLLFLQNWILSFAGGIATYMLVQGLIVALVGTAMLVSAGFIRQGTANRGGSGHVLLRAAAAVVLLAAIPFSAYYMARDYYTQHVKPFMSVQEMHGKMTPGEAFDATMGGKIGKYFIDGGE